MYFMSHGTSHVSHVMGQVSGVKCQVSLVIYIKKKIYIYNFCMDKVVELVVGGSVFNGAYTVLFCVKKL